MRFSELYDQIEHSVSKVKEDFNVYDTEIIIKADDENKSTIAAYLEMDEEGEFYILFDIYRNLICDLKYPVICHYISNFKYLKEFKEWLEKSPSMNPRCIEIKKSRMYSIIGIDTIIKYRYKQKPKVEIYIQSELILDSDLDRVDNILKEK